ncbi:hypothetical protein BU16DRAFT_129262 [Lophium mytilinum]|uniref:F-box domain-containing protein n=1 Tax=Lophium mytilinum TaxID=390894 RepID=A0A6A6QHB6_9PEZI|nr:hypothetical protein BU16DRAFT_129262 [Lophium mytilinum]
MRLANLLSFSIIAATIRSTSFTVYTPNEVNLFPDYLRVCPVAKSSTMHFNDLNEDVHNIIISQLQDESPTSLSNLRRVSKQCNKLTDRFVWGSIELSDEGPRQLEQTENLIQQILHRDLWLHVRELRIAEWSAKHDSFDSSTIRKIIGAFKHLQHFHWNANKPIPEAVLSKLETSWPDVKLHVNNTRRAKSDDQEMNMDMRLLLSPLLYSLTYEVFYMSVGRDNGAYSELPKLKEVLLKSHRLRILKLFFHHGVPSYPQGRGFENNPTYKVDILRGRDHVHPLNLLIQPGDKIPPLQELNIPTQYDWSREHCQILRSSMDWTKLRRLDLGSGCPQTFFEEFHGQMPGLKCFHTSFIQGLREYSGAPPTCTDNPGCVVNFIEAIDALEELHISNTDKNGDILFDAILKHSPSLRRLRFSTSLDHRFRRQQPPVWGNEKLELLRERAHNLEEMNIDLRLVGEAYTWPKDTVAILSRFSHLSILRLAVHVPIEANEFSIKYKFDALAGNVGPPVLRIGLAQEYAAELFRQFFVNNTNARLQELELTFKCLYIGDRMDSWPMAQKMNFKKSERDDGPRMEEIKVYSVKGWKVEIENEWKSDY